MIDYKDSKVLGKVLKKATETNSSYYIDDEGTVRIHWNKMWIPYDEAMARWPKEFALD
ncbi:hypothetical protein N9937_00800 [bacterium]|nr:hypothetical protein [bacterium]